MVQGEMVELGGLQVSEKPQRTVSGARPLLGARYHFMFKQVIVVKLNNGSLMTNSNL